MATLRELREMKGLTLAQLAVKANVSVTTVFRMEKGVPVSRMQVGRVLTVLGARPEDVENLQIRGAEPRPSPFGRKKWSHKDM